MKNQLTNHSAVHKEIKKHGKWLDPSYITNLEERVRDMILSDCEIIGDKKKLSPETVRDRKELARKIQRRISSSEV